MNAIPSCFSREGDRYLTLPAMKRFAKDQDQKTTQNREALLEGIEQYAKVSDENYSYVQDWLDQTLKEGIVDIHIRDYELSEIDKILFSKQNVKRRLEGSICNTQNRHIAGNVYSGDFSLVKWGSEFGVNGNVLTLIACKLIYVSDNIGISRSIIYPVFIDIYQDLELIFIRAKSKSNMYVYTETQFSLDTAKPSSAEKEMKLVFRFIENVLGVKFDCKDNAERLFKQKLYSLLDKYTQTPIEIQTLINETVDLSSSISSKILERVCQGNIRYEKDISADVANLIEKYFSISYRNKEIFTKDRDAYPLKIVSTDEEESKVEQTAALEEPLQSKAVFFDNRKMMQKSRICDGIVFKYQRKQTLYFSRNFSVKLLAKKEYCSLKFPEYTAEEDILHVLFSLVDFGRSTNPC